MPVHGHSQADEKQVEFRFDEDLCFNIPFKPVVMGDLTLTLTLTRSNPSPNPKPNPNQV